MTDILNNVENYCVVVLLSRENGQLRDYLDEIRMQLQLDFECSSSSSSSVEREEDCDIPESSAYDYTKRPLGEAGHSWPIRIGEVDGEFKWTGTKMVEIIEGSKGHFKQSSVVIFPPEIKDRSCLLLPPKKYPKAEAYNGPYSKEALLEFINVKCNTYLGMNGGLSIEGLHRQSILANIYSVHKVPSSTTMLDVDQKIVEEIKSNSASGGRQRIKLHATISKDGKTMEEMRNEDESGTCWSDGHEDDGNCNDSQAHRGKYATKRDSTENLKDQQPNEADQSNQKVQSQQENSIPKCQRISQSHLTKEVFLNDYLKRSRPFIVPKGAANWPAVSKWTMDFLRQEYGDKQVHIKLAPDGIFEGVEPASLWEGYKEFVIPEEVRSKLLYPDLVVVRPATQNIRFSKFLQMIQNSSQMVDEQKEGVRVSAYLEYSSIPTYFPKLEEDVAEPDFVQNLLTRRHLNIWLSDGNTLGKLHFDPFDNFLCQLKGKKELILFEPHNNTQLYEAHIPEALLGYDPATQRFRRKRLMDSTSMVMSPVDIVQRDFQRFPEFADARPLNCTIDEGDILFMPAFWWHEVQSYPNKAEGRNLAINFWYEPFLHKEFPCPECKLDINPYYRYLL